MIKVSSLSDILKTSFDGHHITEYSHVMLCGERRRDTLAFSITSIVNNDGCVLIKHGRSNHETPCMSAFDVLQRLGELDQNEDLVLSQDDGSKLAIIHMSPIIFGDILLIEVGTAQLS